MPHSIKFIDEAVIAEKRILLRLDLNVSLNPDYSIADDARIQQSLPTINYLLKNKNRLIILSHLGRPKNRDPHFSLQIVIDKLQHYLPNNTFILVDAFLSKESAKIFDEQKPTEIIVLENTRFYPEEKENEPAFVKSLALLGDVYVNDAFAVSHRKEASVVGLPKHLPSYGGLLLKKEISMISHAIKDPKKPVVAIIGGAKISTKIHLLNVLIDIADYILIGGALANVFLVAEGYKIGESLYEKDFVEKAKQLIVLAKKKNTKMQLPKDVCIKIDSTNSRKDVCVADVPDDGYIIDIGPETQAEFAWTIDKAKTVIWNGPMGYIEDTHARHGTDNIFYAIASNEQCISIVGGGDTIAAIAKEEYLNKITHISTGGGAMLEFIENGTLPGIEALRHSHS